MVLEVLFLLIGMEVDTEEIPEKETKATIRCILKKIQKKESVSFQERNQRELFLLKY